MLSKAKLLLGITDTSKDDLISLLIELAQEEAASFCNMQEYSVELDSIVLKMVLQNYNKCGNEGIASVSFSGINETYNLNYTDDILAALKKHRKLIVL